MQYRGVEFQVLPSADQKYWRWIVQPDNRNVSRMGETRSRVAAEYKAKMAIAAVPADRWIIGQRPVAV
jgi:hypothetical protein